MTLLNHIAFTGKRQMVEYEVLTEVLKIKSDKNNFSVASLQFVFRRKMEYHVSNTFVQVPTLNDDMK